MPKFITVTGFSRLRHHIQVVHGIEVTAAQSERYRLGTVPVPATAPTGVQLTADELIGFFGQVNNMVEQGKSN